MSGASSAPAASTPSADDPSSSAIGAAAHGRPARAPAPRRPPPASSPASASTVDVRPRRLRVRRLRQQRPASPSASASATPSAQARECPARAVGRHRERQASPDRGARYAQPAHPAAGGGTADRGFPHAGLAADLELQRADHHEHRMARVLRQAPGKPERAGWREGRGSPRGNGDRHARCGRHLGHHGRRSGDSSQARGVPRAPERVREGGGRCGADGVSGAASTPAASATAAARTGVTAAAATASPTAARGDLGRHGLAGSFAERPTAAARPRRALPRRARRRATGTRRAPTPHAAVSGGPVERPRACKGRAVADAMRHIEAIEAILNGASPSEPATGTSGSSAKAKSSSSPSSLDRAQIEKIRTHLSDLRKALNK